MKKQTELFLHSRINGSKVKSESLSEVNMLSTTAREKRQLIAWFLS